MGQGISSPVDNDGRPSEITQEHPSHNGQVQQTSRAHSHRFSRNRFSQLLQVESDANDLQPDAGFAPRSRGSAMLERTRWTVQNIIDRHAGRPSRPRQISRPELVHHHTLPVHAGMNGSGDDYYPPRLPSIDHTSLFENENEIFTSSPGSSNAEPLAPRSSGRPHLRALNSLIPDRPFRHFASLRRRRSARPAIRGRTAGEDQAAILSHLLSSAAAATAATLMGEDHHALTEARSLTGGTGMGDIGGGGEDGSFDGFLRALQNGRIASALRGEGPESETNPPGQPPLNFFRMFRFGSSTADGLDRPAATSPQNQEEGNESGPRMVPIIIVGIRSISPSTNSPTGSTVDDTPLMDALNNVVSPLPSQAIGTATHESIDSILRPAQNGTSFRHRRRASMGAFGMRRNRLNDRMDDQRDHRSPDHRRDRPWSIASSTSTFEPRPPPATPASLSPDMSRISSRTSTPSHSHRASIIPNSSPHMALDPRLESPLLRSPLSSHTEETASLHSTHSSTNLLSRSQDSDNFRLNAHRRSDTLPNVHYPRFASGHPRRNGMVEPDALPPLSRVSTSNYTDGSREDRDRERRESTGDNRSWIIYVLGGSYPDNHPMVTTPSLFSENPTYEDMMLLAALLGPAKAPVASEEDVKSAGGIYSLEVSSHRPSDAAKTTALVAVATETEERLELGFGQRCLVCLCDFEATETARKLVKCGHLFHRECIDQVSFLAQA